MCHMCLSVHTYSDCNIYVYLHMYVSYLRVLPLQHRAHALEQVGVGLTRRLPQALEKRVGRRARRLGCGPHIEIEG